MSKRQHLLQVSLGVLTYKDNNSIFKVILTIVELLKKKVRRKKSKSQQTSLGQLKAISLAGILKKINLTSPHSKS